MPESLPEPNLYDPDHSEWFLYDSELLNAWYWEQFENELNTDSIFKNKGTPLE